MSQAVLDCGFPEADPKYDLMVCPFTNGLIRRDEATVRAPILPQASTPSWTHPLSKSAYRSSVEAFQESDGNCNTCQHFIRTRTTAANGVSASASFIYGNCSHPAPVVASLPYIGTRDELIKLHPADYIGMPCHEQRSLS
jgi:hypothetical protein